MKTVRRLTVIACCMAGAVGAGAQEALSAQASVPAEMQQADSLPRQWDLRTCIDYALEQNITIRRNRISAESSEVDMENAKAALLPTVSGNISQRVVNRPRSEANTIIDGDIITNTQRQTSYNGSYGIDANWTLFMSVAESENSIQESIAQLYVQILYAAEAVKVNESTLEVSKAQHERGVTLFESGSISKSDLAQLEAQVSSDNYQLVSAQATLQDYKLQLKHLLELDGAEEMNLYIPALGDETVLLPLPEKDDVFRSALALRPEIESGKLNVEAADLSIKMARSGYMPTLSLSAGIGTSHTNGNSFSFSEQVKQNWNNSLGLTLSIPIFDQKQTRSSIRKAKLQKMTSQLDLMDEQKTLYRSIENLWLNANSAQQQYVASVQNLKSSQASFDLLQEQFSLGMINVVELMTGKSNLLSAQQQLLQAKYTAILNMQLLKFYQGEPLTL